MKPLQGDTVSNESCSCTSCDYKTESDRQSLRRFLAQGSRISKVMNGKYYVPLRESKLLEKLARTRALYEALRSQLLSSSISISSKANLKPSQSPIANKQAIGGGLESSDISALVDLVHKGVLRPRQISECCSCCNCKSKARFYENVHKGRRNRQAHPGGNITSKSSVISKQDTSEAKNIKSDPCTRASKCEMITKLQSNEMLKKMRPKQPIIDRERFLTVADKHKLVSLNNETLRKSFHKLKRSKGHPTPYMENIGEGGVKTKKKSKQPLNKPDVKKMKSTEQIKPAQDKVNDNFVGDRKGIQNFKPAAENTKLVKIREPTFVGKHPKHNGESKQRFTRRLRRNSQAIKNKRKAMVSSSTSSASASLQNEKHKPLKTDAERQKSPSRKLNKNNTLAASTVNKDLTKKLKKPRGLAGSTQIEKSNAIKVKSSSSITHAPKKKSVKSMTNLPSTASSNGMIKVEKHWPLSKVKGNVPNKSKTNNKLTGKLPKSISSSSIKKTLLNDKKDTNVYPTVTKKSSLNVQNNQNENKLKSTPSISFHKKLQLLEAPMRFAPVERKKPIPPKDPPPPTPAKHPPLPSPPKDLPLRRSSSQRKKSVDLKQKNTTKVLPAGGHTLKRCFCSLKLKVQKTKSRISKNFAKEIHRNKATQSLIQGSDSKLVRDLKKTSLKKAFTCECSSYITRSGKRDSYQGHPPKNLYSQISTCDLSTCDNMNCETKSSLPIIYCGVKSSSKNASTEAKDKLKSKRENTQTASFHSSSLSQVSICECSNITIEENRKRQTIISSKLKPTLSTASTQTKDTRKQKSFANKKSFYSPPSLSSASICECSNYDFMSKEISKHKVSSGVETASYYASNNDKEKQLTHPSSFHSPNSLSHVSICECPKTKIESKTKRESKHKPSQTIIHSEAKSTTTNKTKERNKTQETLARKDSSYSMKSSSSQTSIIKERKRWLKYKHCQTDTHAIIHITSDHASIQASERRRCQSHFVQTVNNITPKQTRGTKYHPDSISPENKIIVKDENIVSAKQQDNNKTDKPRFSLELFKKGYSKNIFKVTLDSHSKINQGCLVRIHKGSDKSKHIRNKRSQVSNSTGKSKYTVTKHGLRRCFCTLKLGKLENKKRDPKKVSKRTMNLPESKQTSSQIQHKVKNVSISSEIKKISEVSQVGLIVLPYGCDPEFCDPRKFNLPEFKVALASREDRKLKKLVKTSTQNRKTKSHASLTSQSAQLPRSKNVYSNLVSNKSENLLPVSKKTKIILRNNSTQHIRPSFNTNFLKGKRSSALYPPIERNTKHTKLRASEGPKLEGDSKSIQHSIIIIDNKKPDKSSLLGPTIRRLCTLKIHKKEKYKSSGVNTDTKTEIIIEKVYPDFQKNTVDSKSKPSSQLRPYGSKTPVPSTCFPGECKNHECPENIKKRKVQLFDNGMVTQKTKMVSKSSDTRKFKSLRKYSDISELGTNHSEINSDRSITQSVRIGSKFSFNLEFYKGISPERNMNNMHFLQNNLPTDESHINQNFRQDTALSKCFCALKLLKKDKYPDNQLLSPFPFKKPTQVYAVNTVTIARNKINPPELLLFNEVNVGSQLVHSCYPNCISKKTLSHTKHWQYIRKKSTSILSISTIGFKSKTNDPCKLTLPQTGSSNQSLLDVHSEETIRFKSKFRCKIDYSNNINLTNQRILRSVQSHNDSFVSRRCIQENQDVEHFPIILKETTRSQLTGVQPLLRRCYCTMNIHVTGQQHPKKKHHSTRLKDYECEPGVCIPYECDPYECQKMIMKRLMKKVSRTSGTERKLKNSSSLTSSMSSGSKSRKLQSSSARERKYRAAKEKPTGLRYQSLPRSSRVRKQVVKVGSSFSFDIEFSKGSSKSPRSEYVKVPKRTTTSKSCRTPYRGHRDRESQSVLRQMRHRASSVTPMLKRCFCTLKLHKKGRQQKERELKAKNQGTITPPKIYKEKPILRTTETGQNTRTKRFSELLPYECEPNICVPGECNPYECLELIKKRRAKHTKEFGTDSMSRITSSSSMTPSQKRKGKQIQAKTVRVKPIRSTDTAVRPKHSVMSADRQAVRIGSSFSFNVEFFKDKSDPHDERARKNARYTHVQKRTRESFCQDRKSTRDSDSQIGLAKHGRSTMTSGFLKRCFCTAKLQGIKVDAETTARQHRSFATLKRCFCTLKALTARKENNVGHERAKHKHVGKTQTRRHLPVLEPYECEPGVCVPGFCDPYECEKLIRRRRAKEKMAGTTGPRTRSTSSGFTSSRSSKALMTYSKSPRAHRAYIAPRETVKSSVSPGRQAVRIGSNFSFNIEFYKNQFPNYHQVQAAAVTVKKPRPTRHRGHGMHSGTRTRDRGLRGRRSSVQSRESQIDRAKRKDKALGPILKRCFCTLKLHKQHPAAKKIDKKKHTDHGTETPTVKQVPTSHSISVNTSKRQKALTYKLEPYECEPGTCVPGECDPYECEKRIKRRLMHRDSGTLTDRHRTKSSSNMTRHRYRHGIAQSAMQRTRPVTKRYANPVSTKSPKQVVKIGSSFSFDIEFFKDKSPDGSFGSSRPTKQYYERPRRTSCKSTEWQTVSSRNRRAQRSRAVRDMDSQVLARKMRSTMTGVGPFLKRCFCTLQLHKAEKQENSLDNVSVATKTVQIKTHPKIDTTNAQKATNTRKPPHYSGRKLEPYECEPGVCVPGQCDPYECEKRIKARMQSKYSSTESYTGRSVSSSIGETIKTRPRRTQASSYTPSHKKVKTDRGDDRYRGQDHDSSPNRQVVRIGSSFSFNVEFYKDPGLPSARNVGKIIHRGIKGTETRRSISQSHDSRRVRLRDYQSQTDFINRDSKASSTPFLKRCFCTLKLQKMGKQHYTNHKVEPTSKSMGTHTSIKHKIEPVAREIGTKTKRYTHTLEPYECEPGFCIPGQCDPYECEKRIKLRHMKHFDTATITSRSQGTKAVNTYMPKDRGDKTRKTSIETIYKVKSPRHPPRASKNPNRQAVHLGSNFSFNVEFYKNGSMGQDGSYNENQRSYNPYVRKSPKYKSKASISTANRNKYRTHGSHGRIQPHYDRTSQIGAQMESRGSGAGPLLKRCFCTLTLQRAEVRSHLNSPVPKHVPSKAATVKAVKTVKTVKAVKPVHDDTKSLNKKKNYSHQLDPDECEPGVCVPGECNPYECLERIKKRGIRRMSRTTGTRVKRSSQVSVSSVAAQFIPGYTSRRTQYKDNGMPRQKIERIVEEPRFPFLRNYNRQGVRISSNFSINIEFFKENSPPVISEETCEQKPICRAKDICVECNTKQGKYKTRMGRTSTKNELISNGSQSEPVKTENKSSAVAVLRRCFCTAKLHKPLLARSQHPQTLTVGRVEEIRPLLFRPQKEFWVQYQIQQPAQVNNNNGDSKKLETIMNYEPSKFNHFKVSCPTHQCKFCQIKAAKSNKPSTLKHMWYCCKKLFTKHANLGNDIKVEKKMVNSTIVKEKSYKLPGTDILKPSKSERKPNNVPTSIIKKSKSLKVAKVSVKDINKKKYSRFQSGDAGQGTAKKLPNYVNKTCPRCQAQKRQVSPRNKQVRFSLGNDEAVNSIKKEVSNQKIDSKSVSFLFKGSLFKNPTHLKYHVNFCYCCGRIKKQPTSSKLVENIDDTGKTVLPKPKVVLPQEYRKKHKQSCPCCACKKIRAMPKQVKKIKINTGPCVCGSVVCKKEADKLKENLRLESKRNKIKKCVCGMEVCATESERRALLLDYESIQKQIKEQKKLEKEAQLREKRYEAEDKAIMKKRKKRDKYMLKHLQRYKEAGDALLVAESVADVCKLGITSAADILRTLSRAISDPKRTYKNLQKVFRDPTSAWKKFRSEGPGAATLKRLRLRCHAMSFVKKAKGKLEEQPITNYVLHANDADPQIRFHGKKPAKQRRADPAFACSPFMLSLRKRPWLSVYYKCSWFYPHCLSLLQVWRQFTDITLFLLAVAVWSPCILTMELCRALMCCFLCTG